MQTRKQLLQLLVFLIFICACQKKSDPLNEARKKLQENLNLSYTQTGFWPIPEVDIMDTIRTSLKVLYDKTDSLKISFISVGDRNDYFFKNDVWQVANHKDKTLRVYLPKHFGGKEELRKEVKKEFQGIKHWSPMTLFKKRWQYRTDTVMDNKPFKAYARIEGDRTVEGNKILTEQHIFIGPDYLLERFERRNFFNGSLSQRLVFEYSDYELNQGKAELIYDFPANYVSVYGKEKPLKSLKEGQIAPQFMARTVDGDSVNLTKLKGKKTLLNFSVTTCGYCMMTLNYMNQDNYILKDEVNMFYINPEDDEVRMRQFMENKNIPIPVIANAGSIGKEYGVNGYPAFFLIDERGVIERVYNGFSEEFLDTFRK